MTAAVKGRSTMALYSSDHSIHCHRVRFVLAEKGINVDIIDVTDDESAAADLAELNPYNETPTLVDRDLLLHNAGVINDYLDERYPHPPLMPVDPVTRAQFRLALSRIERDWYSVAEEMDDATDTKRLGKLRKMLKESILSSAEIFAARRFFLSDEFSLVDCRPFESQAWHSWILVSGCHLRSRPVQPSWSLVAALLLGLPMV